MVTNLKIFVTRFVTRFCYALSPYYSLDFNYFSLLANICYKVTKISVKIRVEGVRGEVDRMPGRWRRYKSRAGRPGK